MRPRSSWSWSHSLQVAITRHHFVSLTADQIRDIDDPDYRDIVPTEDAEGVWIDGVPQLVTGELKTWAAVAGVEPIKIPGYWYSKKGIDPKPSVPVQRGEKVFLYLHGGGYVVMSAHPSARVAVITRVLVETSDTAPRALSVEYRLSSTDPLPRRHPFPTALLDALAGYNHLVNVMGYDPADIIIAGDSAGGNLALALARCLVEYKDATNVSLPAPPGYLLLVSPWTDVGDSHDLPHSSVFTNVDDIIDDLVMGTFPLFSKRAFVGVHGMGMASYNRYISPGSLKLHASFKGFPPTFIIVGKAERLYNQIITLRDKMIADMGEENVTCYEGTDAVHDYLLFPSDSQLLPTQKAIQHWLSH